MGSETPAARRVLDCAERAVANPGVAYAALLAVQLRVVWRVWDYKDLPFGDTAFYFLDATAWARGIHDDIVWSPLYTDFFGTAVAVFRNPHAAVVAHRVIIVFGVSILVLAAMRCLLGPPLGLAVAVWWTVLPPNFNVAYEVHLFGVLPILVALLLVARNPSRRARGAALGVLFGGALLVRNELAVTTALFAVGIVVHELRSRRHTTIGAATQLRAYGVPLAVALTVAGAAYWRSFDQGSQAIASFSGKAEANFCQGYAFDWQQRHPTRFTGNPFTQCEALAAEVFGRPAPTLIQATEANPRAVAAMAGWNLLLLPGGVQVALFGASGTGQDPDYFPVRRHDTYALLGLLAVVGVTFAGIRAILRERDRWRRDWWIPHCWAAILLASVALNTLLVVLIERPAPEYMYGLTLGMMAVTAVGAAAVLRAVGAARFVGLAVAVGTIVTLLAVSPFYSPGPRPIEDLVSRTQSARRYLRSPADVLVTAAYSAEACSYLEDQPLEPCTGIDWSALRPEVAAGASLRAVLVAHHVAVVYVSPELQSDPLLAPLMTSAASLGYRTLASGVSADGRWSVLVDTAAGRQGVVD